jgi:hypothetical protein
MSLICLHLQRTRCCWCLSSLLTLSQTKIVMRELLLLCAGDQEHGLAVGDQHSKTTLADLPGDVVRDVTHLAGIRSRQLSKAMEAAFGPLLRLRPFGISTMSAMQRKLRRLVARHKALLALDLCHVGRLLDDAGMRLLADGLPALQQLSLGCCRLLTPPGLAALSRLPCLVTLDLSGCRSFSTASLSVVVQLSRLQRLSFQLDGSFIGRQGGPALALLLTRLQQLTHLHVDDHLPQLHANRVLSVLAAASALPNLASLDLSRSTCAGGAQEAAPSPVHLGLRSLSVLCPPEPILDAIGSMTALQHLSLDTPHRGEVGCVARLSTLQSLALVLHMAVPLQPLVHSNQLTELRMLMKMRARYRLDRLCCLAEAADTLRVLHLSQEHILWDCARHLVAKLTNLTDLHLENFHRTGMMLDGVAFSGLASLRALSIVGALGRSAESAAFLCQQLAPLTSLRRLALRRTGLDDGAMAGLTALRGLEVLDVSTNLGIQGPGLQHLHQLPELQEVTWDLGAHAFGDFLHNHVLPPPPTLRRCRLRHCRRTAAEEEVAAAATEALTPYCEVIIC